MIVAAALLVVAALGLFVWGVVTGATALYWACVAVSAVAAVLLILARRRLGTPVAAPERREEPVAHEQRSSVPARRVPEPAETTPEPVARTPVAEEAAPEAVPQAVPNGVVGAPVADGGIAAVRHGSREERSPVGNGTTPAGDPPIEEVEVTDLLLVVDLTDEVLVIDEHPRYHLAGCPHLAGHEPIPLPLDEARSDGFTPCAVCAPDRHLAQAERARRRVT